MKNSQLTTRTISIISFFTTVLDDTTYDTVFQTTQGDTLILRVNIPLASTMTLCPAMSLAGVRVQHAWVDSRMRVIGYEPIQSETQWRSSKLSLSEAVHAVVKQFQLYPPTVLEITDQGLRAIQPNKNNNNHRRSSTAAVASNNNNEAPPDYSIFQQQQQQQQQQNSNNPPEEPIPDVTMPEIPREFPEISTMTREDLEELLTDETEFLALVHQLPIYEELQTIGTSVMEDNVTMATKNLEQEEALQALRTQVDDLNTQLTKQVETFETLQTKQDALCAPPNKRDVLRKLGKAKKESFESSEELAEEWVENGDLPVDDFVKRFVAARRVHHERAAKIEILSRRR